MDNRENESQAAQASTILIVCPSIALIFVAFRTYTRFVLTKKYFLEDYMIIAAMASIGTIHFYTATHFFLKLSILLQYLRISVMPSEKRTCYIFILILACGTTAFTIINLAHCRPFAAQWNPGIPGAQCTVNRTVWFYSNQAFHILLDFSILIIPFFILRHLTVPTQQRLLIGVVLGFGGIACIASVIRLHTLYTSTTSKDPTWDRNPSGYYGQAEVNLGIACACVVTLKPLWQRLPGILSLRRSQQDQGQPEAQETKLPSYARPSNKIQTSTGSTRPCGPPNDVELGAVDSVRSWTGFSTTCSETIGVGSTKSCSCISCSSIKI
ncbi:hypothetical protein B0I35DRAFT_495507 [Stachybotrys elegans]|uniref:Rhodopsin domain-containing protein n=1 Tax=Stachybotrys elegans TaxID=80388 RepID=A0A8K0SEL0_9HYPO|nr:hypothetical protein B0I35DRAFT_495507 [Stachybotrys elegans]